MKKIKSSFLLVFSFLFTLFVSFSCDMGNNDATVNNSGGSGSGSGTTKTWYADLDRDGFGNPGSTVQAATQPSGYVSNSDDTDDNNANTYPGASEIYDGADNNGDGHIDEGCVIWEMTFNSAAETTQWTRLADADSSEATITFENNTGSSGGSVKFSAENPHDGRGKAYIFQLQKNDIIYRNSTLRLEFDVKMARSLVGTGLHLQTEFPGTGTTNTFDIQTRGINDSTWTKISIDVSGITTSTTGAVFRISFNMASGAFVGAGGAILVDNIRLICNN